MELLEGERVLAFDLETTGVSTSRDRIVQLALIGSNSDGTEISYDQFVNPRRSIPYESQRIHGISDADVRGQPDFAEIADRVSELIDGCVLIGH
ncbi:MAG: 3'-5' exonuclease, partial [Candidatus Thermoplasmatota archaeon]|nr:3'-5' exonuclease [Candidatus Thermoplasmatota archaeon]